MEPRVSIVTIAVDDLDREASFYQAMGLTRHRIDDGVAFFQMGGVILALFPRKSAEEDAGVSFGSGVSRVYLAYNTRSDTEVNEVLELAAQSGGRIVKPAGRAFWGGWYGYFADPEDNIWEVAHN
ncbi:MAG: VOC family protein, partial [Rhizobiaceae bacterium]|nr:VOC family protein [Rhizobiaceae bacterium]